jgi:tRNA A37 N6-isopentenylltransferase MiaA
LAAPILKYLYSCTESAEMISPFSLRASSTAILDLPAAVAETKKATRNYAKRQLTWFRRDDRICWYLLQDGEDYHGVLERIMRCLCRSMNIFVE